MELVKQNFYRLVFLRSKRNNLINLHPLLLTFTNEHDFLFFTNLGNGEQRSNFERFDQNQSEAVILVLKI